METITFKLQEDIVKKIDAVLAPLHFNNRTEFIRESIREKLIAIEGDIVIQRLAAFKGSAKKKVTDEEIHQIREKLAKKLQ